MGSEMCIRDSPGMDEVLGLSGIEISGMETGLNTAKFDISTSFALEGDGSLVGSLEYDADLFAASSVGGWVDAFTLLIEGLVSDSAAPVLTLPILNEEQREEVIAASSGSSFTLPEEINTLVDVFTDSARKVPDNTCIIYGDDSATVELSYEEVDQRSNQLARYLIERGVGLDTIVAVMLEPSADRIISILGIMKAGGAYLPLDPEYPAQRLSFMMGDSGAGLIVSTAGLMDKVSLSDIDDAVGVIDMEDTLLELRLSLLSEDEIDQGELSSPFQPNHLAYLIYTSGSTGTPKGVAVTHETAVNLGYSQIAAFGLTEEDCVLQLSLIHI